MKTIETAGKIKVLGDAFLAGSAEILRAAFGKVTTQFGITRENAPMYAAFTTVEQLKEMKDRGAVFYGYSIGLVFN